MKKPDEIKMGLEYASTTNIARKVMLAKAGRAPYAYTEEVAADALAYIQSLEVRLVEANKTLDDLRAKLAEYEKPLEPLAEVEIYGDEPVWLEMRAECDEPRIVDIVPSFVNPAERTEITFMGQSRRAHLRIDHYGNSWRCWPRKPTDEERKAAKWDD